MEPKSGFVHSSTFCAKMCVRFVIKTHRVKWIASCDLREICNNFVNIVAFSSNVCVKIIAFVRNEKKSNQNCASFNLLNFLTKKRETQSKTCLK